ncbi:hypothetical protein Tco_0837676 [Tanacetum coccineum]
MEQMTTLRDLVDQVIQKKEEEKRIAGKRTSAWMTITSVRNIEYVDASPPDVEIVSLEVVGGDVDPEIDSLRDNPTPSSEVVIKSTSTSPNLFLEETNTFDNSIPESETFRFNLEEISSGSPTTRSDLSFRIISFYVDNDILK